MDRSVSPHQEHAPRAFAALHHSGFRMYFLGNALVMMADAIEHVISYWIIFQKFHSPALGGFAVISHWVPFLLFSIWAGSLSDRFDPRRIIQIGMALFIIASLAWGLLFAFDVLEMWHAAVILVIHGLAGVFWGPPAQMLIHDIVGPRQLQSGVRLLATGRMLGLLVAPVVGYKLMTFLSPATGLLVNAAIYLPLTAWLIAAPYGPKFREAGATAQRAAVRGYKDVVRTLQIIREHRIIISMTAIAGAGSMLVGSAFQAQMPEFATDLGQAHADFQYGVMLSATAAGSLFGGLVLESRSLLPARPKTALILILMWGATIAAFAASSNFYLSTVLLFAAGFLHLAFFAMTQTLVQIHAPAEVRGRVIGLYNTFALGLQSLSGVSVGIAGNYVGIHWSLGLSGAVLVAVVLTLAPYTLRADRSAAIAGG